MAKKTRKNNSLSQMDENMNRLDADDAAAKAAGQLVNRYIQEAYADGYAFYKIIRENRKTVRIRVVTGIGDDWHLPYWGSETTIDKSYAQANIRRRDDLAKLFSGKGAKRG